MAEEESVHGEINRAEADVEQETASVAIYADAHTRIIFSKLSEGHIEIADRSGADTNLTPDSIEKSDENLKKAYAAQKQKVQQEDKNLKTIQKSKLLADLHKLRNRTANAVNGPSKTIIKMNNADHSFVWFVKQSIEFTQQTVVITFHTAYSIRPPPFV